MQIRNNSSVKERNMLSIHDGSDLTLFAIPCQLYHLPP